MQLNFIILSDQIRKSSNTFPVLDKTYNFVKMDYPYCSEGSVIKPILAIPALAAILITRATCS